MNTLRGMAHVLLLNLLFSSSDAQMPTGAQRGQQATTSPVLVYKPSWDVGDEWTVRFQLLTGGWRKTSVANQLSVVERSWHYRVERMGRHKRYPFVERVATIRVDSAEELPSWRLFFDATGGSMLYAERIGTGRISGVPNPYGGSSWMHRSEVADEGILLDYCRFPAASAVDTVVEPTIEGVPPFLETILLDIGPAREMVAQFERQHPQSGQIYTSLITWRPKAKWWTKAEYRINGDVILSGILVP